jgi:zinc-ribbon family
MLESFFFFIGGLQPKIKVIDERPRPCPRCGLHQAYLKRVDHYLSIFFIPILKVKTGEPVLICDRCERPVADWPSDIGRTGDLPGGAKSCRFCSKDFPREYSFCPICGRRL